MKWVYRRPSRIYWHQRQSIIVLSPAASGAISGTASITAGQSAQLTGTGELSGTAAVVFGETAALGAPGAISGTAAITVGQSASLEGSGALAGTSAIVVGQSADLSGTGTLAGTSVSVFGESANLSTPGAISGTASLVVGQSAVLAGLGTLQGTAPIVFQATLQNQAQAEKRGGAGGWRRHGKKSWWVLVGDERHKVTSKAEEQSIIQGYVERKEQELALAVAGTETAKARGIRISLTRALKRLDKTQREAEQERIKRLMQDDEDLIFILSLH